ERMTNVVTKDVGIVDGDHSSRGAECDEMAVGADLRAPDGIVVAIHLVNNVTSLIGDQHAVAVVLAASRAFHNDECVEAVEARIAASINRCAGVLSSVVNIDL